MLSLFKTPLGRLRIIAFAEGMSFLILLFIAMPLKYIWQQPVAVSLVGSLHGLLFVLYVLLLVMCSIEYRWKWFKTGLLFLASIIPFGTFYADKHYLREE